MKTTNVNMLLVGIALFSGCASAPSGENTQSSNRIPDWVSHPQSNYSGTQYLTSVGTGSTRDSAIEDAKKQMAESFVVKVKSETQSLAQSNLSQNTAGNVNGDASQNVQKNVSLQTETYLRGAEVKEVTQVGSQYYALIALDKLKARSGLLLEANRIQGILKPTLDELEQNFTVKGLASAHEKMASLEQLYGEASALGMAALIDVNPLESRLQKIESANHIKNKKLLFTVKTLKGDDRFQRDVESCINDHGGVVYSPSQAPVDCNRIELSVIERPQHLVTEGWQKIRFDLTGAVIDSGGKMYRIQTNQIETGRSHDDILETVSDKLSKDFCENLFSRMSEVN